MQENKKYIFWGIIGAIVLLGTIATYYYVRNTPFMKRSLLLTAEFESISSLRPGSRVFFNGMEVGKVLDIYLNPETGHIMVDFDVKSGVSVPHNAEAVAYVPSIIYSARLEIRFQADGSNEYLENGDVIPGSVGSYILDIRNQFDPYAKIADSMVLALFPTKDSIRQVISSVEASISQFYRGSNMLAAALKKNNEEKLRSKLLTLEKNSSEILVKLKDFKLDSTNKRLSEIKSKDFVSKMSKINPDSVKIPDIGQYSSKISEFSLKMAAINNGADTTFHKFIYDKDLRNKVTGSTDSVYITIRNIREHPEEKIRINKKK